MRKLRLLICWTALVLTTTHAMADGVMRDGLGAISTGRGGTNLGFADNGAIIYDNPAAMVNIRSSGLYEIGVDTLMTDLEHSDGLNTVEAEHKPFPLPYLAWMHKSQDDLYAVGLGIFAPAGFGAEWDMVNPNINPTKPLYRYKSLGSLLTITPAMAVRMTERLSVGSTLGVAVSHAELEGPFFIQSGALAGTPTNLDLQATGATLTWSTGLQYEMTERLTLGVTYHSENRIRMDGNANVDVFGLGSSYYDADVRLTWPRSLGAGFMYKLCDHRRVSLDVIWFDWSDAFDDIGLTLSNPTNPVYQAVVGPSISDQFPLDWNDSISVRTGYEFDVSPCSIVRLGYAYHQNQIPHATLTTYIPAILEHAASVGYGRQFGNCRLDTAYQYSWGQDQFVGSSDILGGDFDNSRYDASAHWFSVSFTRRW